MPPWYRVKLARYRSVRVKTRRSNFILGRFRRFNFHTPAGARVPCWPGSGHTAPGIKYRCATGTHGRLRLSGGHMGRAPVAVRPAPVPYRPARWRARGRPARCPILARARPCAPVAPRLAVAVRILIRRDGARRIGARARARDIRTAGAGTLRVNARPWRRGRLQCAGRAAYPYGPCSASTVSDGAAM